MISETKIIIVICDLGDCDLTAKYNTLLSYPTEDLLKEDGWKIIPGKKEKRYICWHCFHNYLDEPNASWENEKGNIKQDPEERNKELYDLLKNSK